MLCRLEFLFYAYAVPTGYHLDYFQSLRRLFRVCHVGVGEDQGQFVRERFKAELLCDIIECR